jgi:hypothetical protein
VPVPQECGSLHSSAVETVVSFRHDMTMLSTRMTLLVLMHLKVFELFTAQRCLCVTSLLTLKVSEFCSRVYLSISFGCQH